MTSFAGAMQLNIKRVRKAGEGEYNPADYLPVSENSTDDMLSLIHISSEEFQEDRFVSDKAAACHNGR